MVALDLDGTLLTSRKSISPLTHTAVRQVAAAGIHVVLATARPPRSVRDYYAALGLATPIVNYNGALIWDERRKKVIEHVPLDVDIARKIIAWGRRKYPELLVSVEILDKWYTDHYSEIPEYMTETARQFTPDFIGPLEAFMTVPITKLMLLGDPKWIADIEKEIPKKFGNKVAQTRSDAHLIQLMNPAISKAMALDKVAKSFNITADEVLAIGDAPNDIHMLEWAGIAAVPENGWKEAKEVAHALIPSNDADGVATALRKFILNP
ncbi:MAG TPA: Cof-type HAD-IIB family hydrolase [Phycisphaerae bacterium]|nr:Cof-type HAD-IIB family hydrolase [Phycisphaerae bacterium]